MSAFNFEKLELPHKIFYIAKFLGMEIDRYNQISANRPMDVNPETIALAAIAYLDLRGLAKYTILQEVVADALKILPELRKGDKGYVLSEKAQIEEFQKRALPEIAQMHITKAQTLYQPLKAVWQMEVEEKIKDIEWIADICTGHVQSKEHPVTLFYPEIDKTFDIDSFVSRDDLYECMMRARHDDINEYLQDREDVFVLLGIPEADAKQILSILSPYVFKE